MDADDHMEQGAAKRRRILAQDENSCPQVSVQNQSQMDIQQNEEPRLQTGQPPVRERILRPVDPKTLQHFQSQHDMFSGRLNLDQTTKQLSWELFYLYAQLNSDCIPNQVRKSIAS